MDERHIDVSVLMLGIDAERRETVQEELREIAEKGDSGSPAGLLSMLREAIAVLRGAEAAWTHAGAQNHRPMPPAEAEAIFVKAGERFRSRFDHELVRNAHGAISRTPAPPLPEPAEGERAVVVVTLVVAARIELSDVLDVRDREGFERALDGLTKLEPRELVALEVVWSPADPRERVGVEAIEARYPELVRLS